MGLECNHRMCGTATPEYNILGYLGQQPKPHRQWDRLLITGTSFRKYLIRREEEPRMDDFTL